MFLFQLFKNKTTFLFIFSSIYWPLVVTVNLLFLTFFMLFLTFCCCFFCYDQNMIKNITRKNLGQKNVKSPDIFYKFVGEKIHRNNVVDLQEQNSDFTRIKSEFIRINL